MVGHGLIEAGPVMWNVVPLTTRSTARSVPVETVADTAYALVAGTLPLHSWVPAPYRLSPPFDLTARPMSTSPFCTYPSLCRDRLRMSEAQSPPVLLPTSGSTVVL